MTVIEILRQKGIKKLEAKERIVEEILRDPDSLDQIEEELAALKETQIATFLEAVEQITGQRLAKLGVEYLKFAEKYIASQNNSCKREASRIVGNMAADYPGDLEEAIPLLLNNTSDDGTVVRWGSAYALSRILLLDRYSSSDLLQEIKIIYGKEQENGVRNQYGKTLKKLKAI